MVHDLDRQSEQLNPYVPRLLIELAAGSRPDDLYREVEGSLAFVDISGFTQLTERLARKGRVGAEEMSDILNVTFADLLAVAYNDGAGLVKWGGDAVLLLFQGDGPCAARLSGRRPDAHEAAQDRPHRHRRRDGSRCGCPWGPQRRLPLLPRRRPGDPPRAAHQRTGGQRRAEVEAIADADEVGISAETAALLHPRSWSAPKGGGVPAGPRARLASRDHPAEGVAGPRPGRVVPGLRAHLLSARRARAPAIAVAFVQFSGTDALLRDEGPEALADALDECMRNVQEATARNGVTFFETDINRDGGKVMLTAGAPRASATTRSGCCAPPAGSSSASVGLPLRVGVNCGPVFAGDFGPPFRRTFSVKGDAINLAARVMGKAAPASCWPPMPCSSARRRGSSSSRWRRSW